MPIPKSRPGEPDISPADLPAIASTRGFVYLEKSHTKNLGDYNSVKITVGVQLPLNPDPETLASVSKTYTLVNEIVDEKLESEILSVDKLLRS